MAPVPPAGGAPVQVIPPQRPLPRIPSKRGLRATRCRFRRLLNPCSRAPPPATIDAALSREASDYLHHHRLPFVQAQVTRNASGAVDGAVLSGQVATDFGKRDAARKVRDFLRLPQLARANQIEVNPAVQSGQVASNQIHSIPQAFFGCWRGTSRAVRFRTIPGRMSAGLRDSGNPGVVLSQGRRRRLRDRISIGEFRAAQFPRPHRPDFQPGRQPRGPWR